MDPSDNDYKKIGNTGGEKQHVLTINEMPIHNHAGGGRTSTDGDHNHSCHEPEKKDDWRGSVGSIYGEKTSGTTSTDGAHSHSFSIPQQTV